MPDLRGKPARTRAQRAVLVIDEDPATGRMARLGLQGPSCQVAVVSTPREGLGVALRVRPDLVLLEQRFSSGNGFELASRLRAGAQGSTAFAFVTGAGSVVDHFRAIQLGAMAYLRKPVEAKRLGAVVDGIFTRIGRGDVGEPVRGPAVDTILQTLRQIVEEAVTGTLVLARPGEQALIRFHTGEMQQARYGPLSDEEALSAMARNGDWQVELREDELGPLDAVDLLGASFEDPTDLSSTDPRLPRGSPQPGRGDPTVPDPQAGRLARPFAPEAALTTTQQEDDDESTMVDPSHPLLSRGPLPSSPPLLSRGPLPSSPPPVEPPVEQIVPTISDVPLDLTRTDEVFEEDVPTPLKFGLTGEPSIPTAPGKGLPPLQVQPPDSAARSGEAGLPRWFREVNRAPLMLVIPNEQARLTLTRAAQQHGFSVLCVESGREGYASATRVRPVALLSDLKLPDMEGRELVAALRTDFMVRETPVLMVSGDELEARIASTGPAAVDPVIRGLRTALAPRVQLYDRLKEESTEELAGPMQPVGIATLLRSIGAAGAKGTLTVRQPGGRKGEVSFGRGGEICGVTVEAPEPTVGPMALLHLVGYEWKDYTFDRKTRPDDSQVPLGNLTRLVDTAQQQNNILLARVFKEGMDLPELTVDRPALDLYLQVLPPDSIGALIRIVEGEPASTLISSGAVTPNVLRSMVFELRSRAVIRPGSLRLVRIDGLTGETPAPPPAPAPTRRRRWLVVLAAGFATAALAAGGYLVYWHLLQR